jgi:homoserine O-acetyltransferase
MTCTSVHPPLQDNLHLLPSLLLDDYSTLVRPRLAWRRVGSPHLPAILVLGGISANRLAWQPQGQPDGWWQALIGVDAPLDTQKYQILSIDYLGGNGDSESPCNSERAGQNFPAITTRDQARAIAALLRQLAIPALVTAIGASYGGMVALALAEQYPHLLQRALVICAAHEPWPLATGWRHVQREIVRLSLRYQDVQAGLQLARALAVTTYRSGHEFDQRFTPGLDRTQGCIGYIEQAGKRFSQQFDPYAYLCLSTSIDTHRVAPDRVQVPVDLIGFDSDQLVPPEQLKALQAELNQAGHLTIVPSLYGHDAFLKPETHLDIYLQQHLEQCA